MRVVFVRHGQQRAGELDGGLTSAGHRMVGETAQWLAAHQVVPDLCLHTPTTRTRQTADGLLEGHAGVRRMEVSSQPETLAEWLDLVRAWQPRLGDHGVLLLVGHHPTLGLLLHAFGPPPEPVPTGNLAAALVLDRVFTGSWVISAAWPGRAG
ncbi:histidine phosphatase family protein [Myxococcota bacterium]|nr:histidine phosphatase family protein [Myxococcota bacterium]